MVAGPAPRVYSADQSTSNRRCTLWVTRLVHVSGRSARVRPYPPGCGFPLPVGCRRPLLGLSQCRRGVYLPCGRLTGVLGHAPNSVGGSMSRAVEMRPGWVPSLLRSFRCQGRRRWKTCVLGPAITVVVSHPSVIGYNDSVMRGFAFVHPSGLPLACAVRNGSLALGFSVVLDPRPYGWGSKTGLRDRPVGTCLVADERRRACRSSARSSCQARALPVYATCRRRSAPAARSGRTPWGWSNTNDPQQVAQGLMRVQQQRADVLLEVFGHGGPDGAGGQARAVLADESCWSSCVRCCCSSCTRCGEPSSLSGRAAIGRLALQCGR